MPAGIPDVAVLLASLQSQISLGIDFFQIPSVGLVKENFLVAYADVLQASRSTYAFVEITSKPLIILTSIILKCILTLLKIICEHTVYHAVLAMKEAWQQMLYASRGFLAYQKTLSPTAIYMEFAFIFLLIGLYALRKYIKKKKYVQRITKWYEQNKNNACMKYNRFVDQVAKTSMLVALMLPHLLYLALMVVLKWFFPVVVAYLANRTILSDLISFWFPMAKTVMVIHQWRSFGFEVETIVSKEPTNSAGSTKTSDGESHGILSMFRKKRTESKYEKTIKKGNSKNATNFRNLRLSDDQKQVVDKALQLLQYWVVYALMRTVAQTLMLIPIVSRLLSNIQLKEQKVSSLPWKQKKSTWLNRIKLSREVFQECKLLFFIWLRLLPTSLTSTSSVSNEDKEAVLEKPKSRRSATVPFSNRPVDIIYERLSPMIVALVSSSSHLLQVDVSESNKDGPQSFVSRGVAWCRSLLDVMVWTKMISEKTKGRIISTLVEWTDLLPAMVTLCMPSYFTKYGIIFVQLIVPSANSARCHESLKGVKTNTETVKIMSVGLRYLKYWIIEGILSWILSAFAPLLAWIPLSTHAILVLWAYAQNESIIHRLYNALEWDLIAFGFLKAHPHQEGADFNDTVTMKVFNSIAKRVPSNLSQSSQTVLVENVDDKESGSGVVETREEGETTAEAAVDANKEREESQESLPGSKDGKAPVADAHTKQTDNPKSNMGKMVTDGKIGDDDNEYVCVTNNGAD